MKRQNFIANKSAMMHERDMQKLVHAYVQEGDGRFQTITGNTIQIISPGRINPYEGPDFIRMAIIIDGIVHIGNGEFHRKSSDWLQHHHHHDGRYSNVLLHIVMENNVPISFAKETIILDEKIYATVKKPQYIDTLSEDLQTYAMQRILRKTSDAVAIIAVHHFPEMVLRILIHAHIARRGKKRTRPYTHDQEDVGSKFCNNLLIQQLLMGKKFEGEMLFMFLNERILGCGKHLQQEIIVNCLLPVLLSNNNRTDVEDIMSWYWSVKSLSPYVSLRRIFPDNPQDFVWQQQGMLEFMHVEHHQGIVCFEASTMYKVNTLLSILQTT